MNMLRRTITGGLAAITLAGAVGFGATTASAAEGDGSGSERAARICANLDSIEDWLNSRIAEVQHRIEYFQSMLARAEAAGRTELATRIQHAIDRLEDRLARLQTRLAKLDDWAAEHCDPAAEG